MELEGAKREHGLVLPAPSDQLRVDQSRPNDRGNDRVRVQTLGSAEANQDWQEEEGRVSDR